MRRLLIVLALAASSCAVNPQIRIVNRGETAIAFAEIAAGGVRTGRRLIGDRKVPDE